LGPHRLPLRADPGAFEALHQRYGAPAYGFALRVTGQPSLAQDVVHDAFMALWRAPEAYDPTRGPFRTFFLSLVHHRAVDTVRREERLRRRTERALNPGDAEDEDVAEGIVEEAWLAVRRKEVREALALLPPDQRDAVEMAYFRGYTQAKIGDELALAARPAEPPELMLKRLRKEIDPRYRLPRRRPALGWSAAVAVAAAVGLATWNTIALDNRVSGAEKRERTLTNAFQLVSD